MIHEWNVALASIFVCICAVLGLVQIILHLFNYNRPQMQLYVCRIVLMVPVYSLQSFLSIVYPSKALLFNTLRDCYEAYVLYLFTKLIINCLGGETTLICHFLTKRHIKHPWPLESLPTLVLDEGTFRKLKRGVLQFVLIKPLTASVALILSGWGLYREGDFSWNQGYLYISVINNISVSISLYCLMLMFLVCQEYLQPMGFVGKFLCVKSVIFFSFWQSCVFAVLVRMEVFGEFDTAQAITSEMQDLILCAEMGVASFFYWKHFSYKEFLLKQKRDYSLVSTVGDLLNVKDVIKEAKSVFASNKHTLPNYKDYSWEEFI